MRYEWPGNLVEFKNVLPAAYLATEVGEEMEMDSRLLPGLEQKFDSGFVGLVEKYVLGGREAVNKSNASFGWRQ